MKIPSWLIPAILLVVSIDLWVSATGEADPYKLKFFPFTNTPIEPAFSLASMARGIGIVLAVTYGIHALRLLLTATQEWMKRIGYLLLVLVAAMLLVETTVITPYIITSMAETGIAKTLRAINPFGYQIGDGIYFGWALMVAVMPLLGVIISAISTIAADSKTTTNTNPAYARKSTPKPKPVQTAIVPNDGQNAPETIDVPLAPSAPRIPSAVQARFRARQANAK